MTVWRIAAAGTLGENAAVLLPVSPVSPPAFKIADRHFKLMLSESMKHIYGNINKKLLHRCRTLKTSGLCRTE